MFNKHTCFTNRSVVLIIIRKPFIASFWTAPTETSTFSKCTGFLSFMRGGFYFVGFSPPRQSLTIQLALNPESCFTFPATIISSIFHYNEERV